MRIKLPVPRRTFPKEMKSSNVAVLFLLSISSAFGAALTRRPDSSISQTLFDDLASHVKLAGISYCPIGTKFDCLYCKDFPNFVLDTTFDSDIDTVGYTGVNPSTKEIIVSFRGTSSPQNWYQNLKVGFTDFKPTFGDCEKCQTHNGFTDNWDSVKSTVFASVKKLAAAHADYTISVVGHSLGGAIASLCAFELKHMNLAPVKLYTFGQPRTGNDKYVAAVDAAFGGQNGTAYRVVHYDDPIPHIPSQTFGYKHHETEYWESTADLSTPKTVLICQGDEEGTCGASTSNSNGNSTAHSYYMNVDVSNC